LRRCCPCDPPCRGYQELTSAHILKHGRYTMHATRLWSHWQDLLEPYRDTFTYPGGQRFLEWLTGLTLNVEEHTVTQALVGLGRPQDWKALESFVEYGAWDRDALEHAH